MSELEWLNGLRFMAALGVSHEDLVKAIDRRMSLLRLTSPQNR